MNLNNLIETQGMLIILMLLGLLLCRIKMIKQEGKQLLMDLVIYVSLPCSIIRSFEIEFNQQILQSCLVILILSIVIQAGSFLLGKFIYNKYEEKRKKVLQYATICSNAGILGNPVAEAAFGSIGLLYASVFLIPQRIFMWSVGVAYFTDSSSKKETVKKVATHPCIIAVALGMVLMISGRQLPGMLGATVHSLANANTALCMLFVGTVLADVSWKHMIDRDSLYYSFIRLGAIPFLVLIGCRLTDVDQVVSGVAVLLAAMPAASVTALMALKYGKDEAFAAKIVSLTTVLSVVTAPLWCLYFS